MALRCPVYIYAVCILDSSIERGWSKREIEPQIKKQSVDNEGVDRSTS